jgi:tagaturonate epimerase
MGERYLSMLRQSEESISRNVAENLFDRHIKPLFFG